MIRSTRHFLLPLLAAWALPLGLAASGEPLVPETLWPAVRLSPGSLARPATTPAWSVFLAKHPGLVIMDWDRFHDAPHRVIGGDIDLPGAPFKNAAELDRALRGFVDGHRQLLATDASGLVTQAITLVNGVWYAHYGWQQAGRPVLETEITFRVSAAGRLMLFGSDALYNLSILDSRFSAADLESRVRAACDGPVELTEPRPGEWLLPRTGSDGRPGEAEPVRVYEVARPATHQRDRVWISATTGQVLRSYSLIRHLTVTGQVLCAVEPQAPGDALENWPLDWTQITVDGVPTTTNDFGQFTVEVPGASPWTIAGQYRGQYADVNRQNGPDAQWSLEHAVNGAALVLSQGQVIERDAYIHTHHTHDFIKDMDPVFDGLDEPLPVNVNINDTCNAYWDGNSINFFLAGFDCPNTAQVAGVVYHEYGHGINDRQYQQAGAPWGMENGAMHEGLADVNAIYLQDESYVSPGWNIRNLDNDRRYPDHIINQVHTDGLIMGGSMYDLRQLLPLDTVRLLYHTARWGRPDDSETGRAFFEYFLELLVADDDNGDLSDLCPHFTQIDQAFNEHGIGSVLAWTVSRFERDEFGLYTPPDNGPTVRFELETPQWVTIDGVRVIWRERGGATETELEAQPDGDTGWTVQLPAMPEGSWIDYWAVADNGAGVELTCPEDAPDMFFRLYYGTPGLQLLDFEANNAGGTGEVPWEWGEPASGPDGAFSGSRLWATGLGNNYDDLQEAYLEFPVRDVLGNGPPGIRFMHWHELESGWDGGVVEISVNDAPWQVVLPTEGYDFVTPDNNIRPQVPAFTGNRDWTSVIFDLTDLVQQGDRVALRFGLLTDTSITGAGWFIDDLEYTGFEGSSDIVHTPLSDTEDVQTAQFPVTAVVDRQPAPDSVILRWRFDENPETLVTMTEQQGVWSAVIPGPQQEGTVWYRIEASGPGDYEDSSPPFYNLWHHFLLGEDRDPPTVRWVRPPVDSPVWEAFWHLEAEAGDNLGVASVQVFSQVGEGIWLPGNFMVQGDDGNWRTDLTEVGDPNVPSSFKLVATDGGSLENTAESDITTVYFQTSIEEDFEDPGIPNWVSEGAWMHNTQLHHTGEGCLSYGVPGQLPLAADATITFNQCIWQNFFDVGHLVVVFQRLHNLEAGDDWLYLEGRGDEGDWEIVNSWTGQSGGWQETEEALWQFLGSNCVELRFRIHLDGNNEPLPSSIIVIDDLRIEYDAVAVDPREAQPADFGITAVWPNPFNPVTRVAFRLVEEGPVDLALFNLQGQRLETLAGGVLPAGQHEVFVDGSALASGLYLVSLESGGQRSVQKVMLVK